jgi:hypothetical protein
VTLTADHLVYAVNDLDAGVEEIEELLGVRAAPGGSHTGMGTRNALLSLGVGVYLEIIAPDPGQPTPAMPLPWGIGTLESGKLVTWAARVRGIEDVAAASVERGYDPGPVLSMSRELPDGTRLDWKLSVLRPSPADGLVPFLIEWGSGNHPASTAPPGCSLLDLEAEHPHPESVTLLLDALGADLQVCEGGRATILATIECPNGTVFLS